MGRNGGSFSRGGITGTFFNHHIFKSAWGGDCFRIEGIYLDVLSFHCRQLFIALPLLHGAQQRIKSCLIGLEGFSILADSDDLDRVDYISLLDGINNRLTGDNVTEYSVLAVQPGGGDMGDEEL